ncbi:hypothetical protein [Halorubrum sp. HHNYT27]
MDSLGDGRGEDERRDDRGLARSMPTARRRGASTLATKAVRR